MKLSSLIHRGPLIMGILNVTPDSFSDGGLWTNVDTAVNHALQMVADGAAIIDIGGASSRPGSDPVSVAEELHRVLPVIKRLRSQTKALLAIDTYKPKVAEACLQLGVDLVNDITGLGNKSMLLVVKKYAVPAVIMHMQGQPKTMQQQPVYKDVVLDITQFFQHRLHQAKAAGITQIILDPGLGFGKTLEHNLQILKRLSEFKSLGCPLLVGPSKKSFIGTITGSPVNDRLPGTLAAVAISIMSGADIVRVHDVRECKQAIQVALAIKTGKFDD